MLVSPLFEPKAHSGRRQLQFTLCINVRWQDELVVEVIAAHCIQCFDIHGTILIDSSLRKPYHSCTVLCKLLCMHCYKALCSKYASSCADFFEEMAGGTAGIPTVKHDCLLSPAEILVKAVTFCDNEA